MDLLFLSAHSNLQLNLPTIPPIKTEEKWHCTESGTVERFDCSDFLTLIADQQQFERIFMPCAGMSSDRPVGFGTGKVGIVFGNRYRLFRGADADSDLNFTDTQQCFLELREK